MKLGKMFIAMNLRQFGIEAGTKETIPSGSEAQKETEVTDDQGNKIKAIEIDVKKAIDTLKKYKNGKEQLEARVKENEEWYRLRHWNHMKKSNNDKLVVEGKSAWLFNSLLNKHADFKDNMPEPNILPREAHDIEEAKTLSSIIPLVLENCDYEKCYSDATWDKLKSGTAIYGVFWDSNALNGLGDICIKTIDMLNIYWEPGITNIQDSKNLFIVSLEDLDTVQKQYNVEIDSSKAIEISEYTLEDSIDTTGKVLLIDWYYKDIDENGKQVLNFVKLANETILYNSMQHMDTLYEHGMYPVVFDVLFPMKGSPAGFGFIDIAKDDQEHIDKLDSIILQNAYESGIPRYWNKAGSGVNNEQFADYSKRLVEVHGNPSDSIAIIETRQLPAYIMNHRQSKIEEMKETSSNRDVSSGGASGGVTAAAAISALQEAGNKTSRDMIKESYRVFSTICKMVIELIRQFYDQPRQFRITGTNGQQEFINYTNAGLKDYPMPEIGNQDTMYNRAYFDIKVKAQKANPYSRVSQNELACNLYKLGAFNPQQAMQIIPMLEMMEFEGKDKVLNSIRENYNQFNAIYNSVMMQIQGQQPMQARGNIDMEQQKAYAEQIADRAKPDMNKGDEA